MPFFDEPPPPAFPQPDPNEPYVPPIWTGPSVLVLGQLVPINLLLAKTDALAIVLERVLAYPNGLEVTLVIRTRDPIDHTMHMAAFHMGEMLRFGVEFADGRKATNVGGPGAFNVEKDDQGLPKVPVLLQQGGGGGGRAWRQEFWLWPLPPPGRMHVVVEWPQRGVSERRQTVDGAAIVKAAEGAITLWDSAKAHAAPGQIPDGTRSVPLVVRKNEPKHDETTGG